MDDSFCPPGKLKKPDRRTSAPLSGDVAETQRDIARHSLNVRPLVDSFSERGLICAVLVPTKPETNGAATVAPAARRADIVILDWQMDGDDGRWTLSIMHRILTDDAGERLRLIAIYTGEKDISGIGRKIAAELKKGGWPFTLDAREVELSLAHCRIVVYAKSGTSLVSELNERSVSEDKLPKRLIGDFADMTGGLLPGVALTSLAAVRENAHKLLDRFHTDLDAAFLTHRACLQTPSDSQRHIVSQIASELHSIMDDATTTGDPAGIDAIKGWLTASAGADAEFIFGADKKLSFMETVDLLDNGLGQSTGALNKKNDFRILTSGFCREGTNGNDLDHRLAWMTSSRTVFNSPPPRLHLGSVLRRHENDAEVMLFLCMRPRCDSARLSKNESFLLLPLVPPPAEGGKAIQLVVQTGMNEYKRVSVCTEASSWRLVTFGPKKKSTPVVAEKDDSGIFRFVATDNTEYEWLGELKTEFAQRVAHRFAASLSRVAVNNSEWLRRLEKLSD
jgi:hypothetical protein